jgi:hypothetical protein
MPGERPERLDLTGHGFAPGHYTCRCIDCHNFVDVATMGNRNQFTGAKGAYRCEQHAEAALRRHKNEQANATELAKAGLMIAVGEDGLRIVSIQVIDYGQALMIGALTKGGEGIKFRAQRVRD